jgi:signal transduction histidine kinase
MSRWFADLFRSTVFRVTLLNALLVSLAVGGALATAWLATRGSLEQGARERIAIEVNAVLNELDKEGVLGAAAAIEWRSARPGALDYLLVDSSGRILAGDMATVSRMPGWHRFHVVGSTNSQGGEDVLARTVRRSDGSLLAVGEELSRGEAVRNSLFGAIVPAGGVALLIGLMASMFVTRRVLRRMEGILATVRSVEAGDLSARITCTGNASDDIDELSVAINRMLERIATLVSAVRRVSTEIAHDLRAPLTHAHHDLRTARWSGDDVERIDAIDAASDKMTQALRLFEALLALAEIDSGTARAGFLPVDLSILVERAVDAYRAEIEASGRSIALQLRDVGLVEGDGDLLTQAIANLVDNAFKHSRDGAQIDVSVGRDSNIVTVTVVDDGPGVDPRDVSTMLRPFGRLDAARRKPGNGLGLAIVDGIARLHGGLVTVRHLTPGLSVAIEILT